MTKYLLKMFLLREPDNVSQVKIMKFRKLAEAIEAGENFIKFCGIDVLEIGYEIWWITKTAKIKILDVWKGRSEK